MGLSTVETPASKSSLIPSRTVLGIVFAAALALAPQPAFAQHGGGGHAGGGGGGHFGGGGGHFGGGSAGGSSGGARSGGTAAGSSRGGSSTGTSTGGSTAGSSGKGTAAGSSTSAAGGTGSQAGSNSGRFVGGNVSWQNPPNGGVRTIRPMNNPTGNRMNNGVSSALPRTNNVAMRGTYAGSRPLPPRVAPFPPRRPIFFAPGGCFNGFFPGFCGGSGFFFGSGFYGPAFGFGWGCSPFWGCPGGYYGLYGGGYYNGGFYGGVTGTTDNSDSGSEISNEFNPSLYAYPDEDSSGGSISAPAKPEMILYLKDGTVYALNDYWVADNKLHYVTSYGGENAVDLNQVDIQHTVDVNAKRGITVTLRPSPAPADQMNQNQAQPQDGAASPADAGADQNRNQEEPREAPPAPNPPPQ